MENTLQEPKEACENLDQEEEEQEDVSTFTCEICIEPVSSNKRFKYNKKCDHQSYCPDCIQKYILAMIEEYNISEIRCPALECDKYLDPLTCRSSLSANSFVRWCDVLCESTLSQYQRVHCPYQNCSNVILNECGEIVKKTMCPNCKNWLCFECKTPWHDGFTCVQTMRRNDVLLRQLMKEKKWRRCPACNHGVELTFGCQRVKCRFANLY
ncbi:hypothetical protein AQUCO_01300921v1 [Aquilegia coerulea]|uniref:RBR-type E3 ubiquitin transferase n=1 Tax=Aquilegia coerulea TaxID=218851 RepID=A0A2G5E402_AQUCA|nr:hypothetical protein AQUCO_01300921v1 [Aquilegia coerulea]